MNESGNGIADYLRTYDRFAEPVKLNIDGKHGVKTLFGTFLSFIHCSALMAVVAFLLISYFKAERPDVYSGMEYTDSYSEINILDHGLLPAIIWYKGYTPLTDSTEISKYVTTELVISTNLMDTQTKKVSWTTCNSNTYSHLNTDSLNSDQKVSALCINFSDSLTIKGSLDSTNSKYVSIKIKPCTLGSSCKPSSELADLSFAMVMPAVSIEHQNYYSPLKKQSQISTRHWLLSSMTQRHSILTRANVIKDYSGVWLSWSDAFKAHELHDLDLALRERNSAHTTCTDSNLHDNSACMAYHEIAVGGSNVVFTTKRVYPYLFQQFAVFGGLNNLLAILFIMIYSRYNEKVKENLILKHVFGFIEEIEVLKGARKNENQQELRNPGRKCFCLCKRKVLTPEETAHQQLKQSALMNMRDNLNILNIVKELNHLKVLCNFFFKSRHSKVASFLELGIYQRNRFEKEQIEVLGGFTRRANKPRRKNVFKLNLKSESQSYPWPLTLEGSTKFLNFHHALKDIEEKASHLKNDSPINVSDWAGAERETSTKLGILGDLEDKFDEFFFTEIMKNTECQQKLLGYSKDQPIKQRKESIQIEEEELDPEFKAQTQLIFGTLLDAVLQQSEAPANKTHFSEMSIEKSEAKSYMRSPELKKSKFSSEIPTMIKIPMNTPPDKKKISLFNTDRPNSKAGRPKIAMTQMRLKSRIVREKLTR